MSSSSALARRLIHQLANAASVNKSLAHIHSAKNSLKSLNSVHRGFSSSSASTSPLSLSMKPEEFRSYLLANKIQRAYFIWNANENRLMASNPLLEPLAKLISANKRDFHNHEALFLEISPITNSLFSAAVHDTTRGQGSGGTRYWDYNSMGDFISDGLRLSQGMGRKNALAGLYWGGGKGQILREKSRTPWLEKTFRDTVFKEYGTFISSLRGCYVTAEDAGVNTVDMSALFSGTRHATCVPEEVGGSGNPSIKTGWGVAAGMEAAANWVARNQNKPETGLKDKRVAVQGLGNVAVPMIEMLFERGVKSVVASDINENSIEKAKELFKNKNFTTILTKPGDNSILTMDNVDIVSPCALGGILNESTIPNIKAAIICGAANNQLLNDQLDDKRIQDRGIYYASDFLVNSQGIVNCANECFGIMPNDPFIMGRYDMNQPNSIPRLINMTFDLAKKDSITTAKAAIVLADKFMKIDHPIWPNRSRLIIKSLIEDQWELQSGPVTKAKKPVRIGN